MYRSWCDARVYIPGKHSVPDVVFVRELVWFGGFGGNEVRYACLAGGVPRVSSFSIHKVEASSCFPDPPFSIVLRTKKKKNMPPEACTNEMSVGWIACRISSQNYTGCAITHERLSP